MYYPCGDWGDDDLADYEYHLQPATRIGAAVATTTINRSGSTEFNALRVVDSGQELSSLLPGSVDQYDVLLFAVDASVKYMGWSFTSEYYFRNIYDFEGGSIPALFDFGFWLQSGYFVIPQKLELLARWSYVVGESGTLGAGLQAANDKAIGLAWYLRHQHAKVTIDLTHLDGAPIDSQALNIFPGDRGWLVRSQLQFSF
jgi:hypothetical protein